MKHLVRATYDAPYEKNGKVYSTYQRNEVLEEWSDGSITVRHKNGEESSKRRIRAANKLQAAIDAGLAIRDRIGRIKWIKH